MKYITLILSLFFVGCATVPPPPLTPQNVAANVSVDYDEYENSLTLEAGLFQHKEGNYWLATYFFDGILAPYVIVTFSYNEMNEPWFSPSYARAISGEEFEVQYISGEVSDVDFSSMGNAWVYTNEIFKVYFPFEYIEKVLAAQKDINIRVYGNTQEDFTIPYAVYGGLILKTGEVKKELISRKF